MVVLWLCLVRAIWVWCFVDFFVGLYCLLAAGCGLLWILAVGFVVVLGLLLVVCDSIDFDRGLCGFAWLGVLMVMNCYGL